MSLANKPQFDVADAPLGPVEGGTSILLTGEDTDALEAVFYRLVAPATDEQSVLLATDTRGTAVQNSLTAVRRGGDDRATILTSQGSAYDDSITSIDDIGDLTGLGMQLSTQIAEATAETDAFRAGIMLCSTIMAEVDDTRSVYRFLNSNFMSELRRSGGLGVCAIDMSDDIGASMESTIAGLETSFSARIHVESTGFKEATLDVSGLPDTDETVEVSW